jgi:hypothetical protein
MLQIPLDAHGTTAGMRNAMERPEEDKWVASFRPDEEQESGAVLVLVDIAAAGRRVFASGALRLPVGIERDGFE